jgi:ABC-type multidrug transport system ATPase subunit/pSer/pThr/pTyr-binding forkhead associated (FHA) protein
MDELCCPKLILEEGAVIRETQEILLTGQEIVIGRDPESGLPISSPLVSRRHARIFPRNGQYLIEDLGSTNSTYLNDRLLNGPQPLNDGDQIRLGKAIYLAYAVAPGADETLLEASSVAKDQTVYEEEPAGGSRTLLAEDLPPADLEEPPLLVVSLANSEPHAVRLIGDRIRLGRAPDNEVVIPSPIVSGHHAVLERGPDGYRVNPVEGTPNPLYYNGTAIREARLLHDGDLLRIGSRDPEVMVSLIYQWPAEAERIGLTRSIAFGAQDQLQIGRDADNDVVLEAPIVSRFHAVVERIGQRYRVTDLHSANGTFVNDRRIEAETWLKPGDTIRIGPYRFVLGQDQLARFDETDGLRVEILGLNKWVRKDLNLLQDISLVFQPREFVVVVGQSGGGKSTLVDAIAGYRPATDGQVLVNDIDIYRHFDAVRNEIGFVPQRDIIHAELTVYQALDYAARLRMPADTSQEERHRRVMEVLDDLDLAHRKDVQISGLSGGQQKRVSIGVELLTKPGLFFLDEPTSGLDPGTETALMHLMRRLADQGRTIVLITHATKNVMLADKVLFLVRGGYLAWFGPPDEALRYFDQYRSERDRRTRPMEFDEIYAVLDDPARGKPADWAARYHESPAYQQYVVQPLGVAPGELASRGGSYAAAPALPSRGGSQAAGGSHAAGSALHQFTVLSSRNIRILTRDRVSLVLMLLSPPLVAMLDVLLSVVLGRDLFNYTTGNMGNALITLFQPGMVAIMVGALAMMREFIKETEVYKRERLVNLKVLPYVLSKLWVAGLLALYQAACYTVIHYLAFTMPGGATEFLLIYVTLLLASLAGMAMGLLASAIAPNANAAPLIVILLIIPQVALGGALIPVPSVASTPISARWSFEALVGITGAASDLAADPCWALPADQRNALTLDQKQAMGCTCMGLNALNPASCSFPGLGAYYVPALDQPEPQRPTAIGDPPPEPVLPPEPQAPADPTDTQAMAEYARQLEAYQQQVDSLQTAYQQQLAAYQAQATQYQAGIQAYQAALANWNIARSTAVGKAESVLGRFHEDFGWAFVDKGDSQLFWSRLLLTWGAQALVIAVMFFITLFAIARKA